MIATGTHNYKKIKLGKHHVWIKIIQDREYIIGIICDRDDPNTIKHYDILKSRYGSWLTTWKGMSDNIYFDIKVPAIYKSDIKYDINQLIKPNHTV